MLGNPRHIIEELEGGLKQAEEDPLLRKLIRRTLKAHRATSGRRVAELMQAVRSLPATERTEFLLVCLESYHRSYCMKGPFDSRTHLFHALGPEGVRRMVTFMNSSRGEYYERLLAQNLLRSMLSNEHPGRSFSFVVDRKVFRVGNPHGAPMSRRADIWVPEAGLMVEVKSGRVSLDHHVRRQIELDRTLLDRGEARACWWFLFYGASPRTLDALDDHSLLFWDLGFGITQPRPPHLE
jgi:hypothetical protein